MPKPGDFFVGVIDLFSILLPGALLLAVVLALVPGPLSLQVFPLFGSATASWLAFLLGAYATGHFIFMIAAPLDRIYDTYRRWKWPLAGDHCYLRANELRRRFFDEAPGTGANLPMNTFKWAKTMLMLKAPAALADVQRYEADSKFFRSLVAVLLLVGLLGAAAGYWPVLALTLVLSGITFVRYAEQRHKSTEWAYQYVIVLIESETSAIVAKKGRAEAARQR